jgi:hypothetical protein
MLSQTDIDALKSIPIADFLEQRGVKSRTINGKVFFSAPYRDDPNPSMKIDLESNRWYDFGTGEKGDIIDLVRKINGCDFKNAVQILQGHTGLTSSVAKSTAPKSPEPQGMAVVSITPIWHKALLEYLQQRNIDIEIARQHCKQIQYIANGKMYFGIGFKNDSGGYEIRNKYFKGCTSKDITIINKNVNKQGDLHRCLVFEGFTDYLSYLTVNKRKIPHGWNENSNDCAVILNSVSNIGKAKPFLEQQFAVSTFLDNDDAGRCAAKEVQNIIKSGHPVWNGASCYANHKDLNDYLMNLPKPKQALGRGLKI